MKKASKNKIIQIRNENNNFIIVSHNIAKNTKLSDFAIRLYAYLKSHSENFYLSYSTIAKYLKISEDKVKKGIRELKQSGFLEIERKGNEFIYKLYDTTANEEYKIIDAIEKDALNYSDIHLIYRIINNQKVSQETRQKVADKLSKILKTNWLED